MTILEAVVLVVAVVLLAWVVNLWRGNQELADKIKKSEQALGQQAKRSKMRGHHFLALYVRHFVIPAAEEVVSASDKGRVPKTQFEVLVHRLSFGLSAFSDLEDTPRIFNHHLRPLGISLEYEHLSEAHYSLADASLVFGELKASPFVEKVELL